MKRGSRCDRVRGGYRVDCVFCEQQLFAKLEIL